MRKFCDFENELSKVSLHTTLVQVRPSQKLLAIDRQQKVEVAIFMTMFSDRYY